MKNFITPQTIQHNAPQVHIPVRRLQSEKQRFHSGKRPPQVKATRATSSVNKSFKSPASVSAGVNSSFFQNRNSSKVCNLRQTQQVQLASPKATKNQTGKQEYLKLFGSERNYQLIRSLLDSAETTQSISIPQVNNPRQPNRHLQQSRAKMPIKTQTSAQNLRSNDERLDTDIQVEKALVDLSEVKTQIEVDKNRKQSPHPSKPPGLFQSSVADYSVMTSQNNMRMSAYSNLHKSSNNQAEQSNGFSKLVTQTATSFFSANGYNSSLTTNVNDLDKEQLKERLMVAEGMLKKLYNRNKELEEYHAQKQESVEELDMIALLKVKQEQVQTELQEKQQEIDDTKTEIQKLQKQLQSCQKGENVESNSYITFLEKRLEDQHKDTKRYLEKYIDIRNFTYTYIENQIKANKKKQQPNNLPIYKQLIDKERKVFDEEKQQMAQQIEKLTEIAKNSQNYARIKELEEELAAREACDLKVQEYVKELVEKNKELEAKTKGIE